MMEITQAVITGATSGIGEALAHLLAKKEIRLLLCGRDGKKLEELKTTLSKKCSVETFEGDLKEKEVRLSLKKRIEEHLPDLLINNAGFGLYGESIDLLNQDEMIQVNVQAPLDLSCAFAKALTSQNRQGIILNVSSVGGFFPTPGMAVYGATKAFLNSFGEALDFELKGTGVSVLTACPGQVRTNFSTRAGSKKKSKSHSMPPLFAAKEILKQIEKRKRVHIFDWRYRLIVFLTPFLPKIFIQNMIYSNIKMRL